MPVLATMFTITTYGTWLRGDPRGWVYDGRTLPPCPKLEASDRARLTHPPYYFPQEKLFAIAEAIGESLTTRLRVEVYALSLQIWQSHFVVGPMRYEPGAVA